MSLGRREFVEGLAALGAASAGFTLERDRQRPVEDPASWRRSFPALEQRVNGHPLIYLDTAATSQRPKEVIDAVSGFYLHDNANPGATLHTLARRANEALMDARRTVADFIGASDPLEVVFTRGTTEAINLVASSWGGANLRADDIIVLGRAEHASNMAPWQAIARRTGARVSYFDVREDGHVDIESFERGLASRPRIVALSHVSNVLGLINPVKDLIDRAHHAGALVLIDAAQSVPHISVNVRELGCDFLAFSGHKMCGPMGSAVLWAKRDILEAMPPYQLGSNMAHEIDVDSMQASDGALKFGAGTPSVADAVGLAAAIRFLRRVGRHALWQHEQDLTRHMLESLRAVPGLRLLGGGEASERIAVFSFTIRDVDPPTVIARLDARGIAVRAGDLASLPLLKEFGLRGAVRASCYLYTTRAEIDSFIGALS